MDRGTGEDAGEAAATATAGVGAAPAPDGSDGYNYPVFLGDDDFLAFRQGPQVGSRAPDGPLIRAADGEPLRLADLWRGRDVLLEFGSLT